MYIYIYIYVYIYIYIIIYQGDWNANIGKDASLYWENVSGK